MVLYTDHQHWSTHSSPFQNRFPRIISCSPVSVRFPHSVRSRCSSFGSRSPARAASDILVQPNTRILKVDQLVVSSSCTTVAVRLLQFDRSRCSSFGSWTPARAASDILVQRKASHVNVAPLVVSSSCTTVSVRFLHSDRCNFSSCWRLIFSRTRPAPLKPVLLKSRPTTGSPLACFNILQISLSGFSLNVSRCWLKLSFTPSMFCTVFICRISPLLLAVRTWIFLQWSSTLTFNCWLHSRTLFTSCTKNLKENLIISKNYFRYVLLEDFFDNRKKIRLFLYWVSQKCRFHFSIPVAHRIGFMVSRMFNRAFTVADGPCWNVPWHHKIEPSVYRDRKMKTPWVNRIPELDIVPWTPNVESVNIPFEANLNFK